MATLKDIQRQIAELEKKASEVRRNEAGKIIAVIKQQIADYNLTPADLFEGVAKVSTKAAKPATKAAVKPANPPKYMDPKTGKTWTGHGKAPTWISAAAKKGKKDDFLIAKVEQLLAAKAAAKAPKTAAPKAAAKPTAAKPVVKATVAKAPLAKKAPAPAAKKAALKPKAPTAKKPSAPATVEPVQTPPAPEATAPDASQTA